MFAPPPFIFNIIYQISLEFFPEISISDVVAKNKFDKGTRDSKDIPESMKKVKILVYQLLNSKQVDKDDRKYVDDINTYLSSNHTAIKYFKDINSCNLTSNKIGKVIPIKHSDFSNIIVNLKNSLQQQITAIENHSN